MLNTLKSTNLRINVSRKETVKNYEQYHACYTLCSSQPFCLVILTIFCKEHNLFVWHNSHLFEEWKTNLMSLATCRIQPAKRTPPKTSRTKSSNTQRTENKTTDVVIHQHSRKLLMMDTLMSETCWAHKKWNETASYIKLVFHSSNCETLYLVGCTLQIKHKFATSESISNLPNSVHSFTLHLTQTHCNSTRLSIHKCPRQYPSLRRCYKTCCLFG